MPPTLRFMLRRLGQAIPIILGIAIFNFFLLHMAPGDAVDVLAGGAGGATPEYVAHSRPSSASISRYTFNSASSCGISATLNLGFSFRHNMPVVDLIRARLPATLLLMVCAIVLAFSAGLVLGVTAARNLNKAPDRIISVMALLAYATPVFWIGLMLILLFSVKLGWLPSSGIETIGADLSGVARIWDVARHLVLPAVTLALFFMALYTRLMRAAMLEVYGLDYVTVARAKGVGEQGIAYRHVLRNALLPMITMLGLQVGSLLGGSVLVETVFGWPGLGRLAFESVFQRDYNLLLGILLLSSALVVLVNLLIDLLYARLDPRIEIA